MESAWGACLRGHVWQSEMSLFFFFNPSVILHPLSCFIKMERTLPYMHPILPFIGTGVECAFPLSLDNGMSFIFIYGLHESVSLAALHAPLPRCCVGISLPARQLNQKLMEDFFFLYKILLNSKYT